jgi:hypothetical protein
MVGSGGVQILPVSFFCPVIFLPRNGLFAALSHGIAGCWVRWIGEGDFFVYGPSSFSLSIVSSTRPSSGKEITWQERTLTGGGREARFVAAESDKRFISAALARVAATGVGLVSGLVRLGSPDLLRVERLVGMN